MMFENLETWFATFLTDGVDRMVTSLLILVGVALETSKQIEAQLMMRHYKGFLE